MSLSFCLIGALEALQSWTFWVWRDSGVSPWAELLVSLRPCCHELKRGPFSAPILSPYEVNFQNWSWKRARFQLHVNKALATRLDLSIDCSISPVPWKFNPSVNWLCYSCVTSVIVREVVFTSWHQPLTTFMLVSWQNSSSCLIFEFKQLEVNQPSVG